MAKSKNINLLPQEEFEASITGRLLKWTMGTFRIIVIITEMVVMAAFLSRFWLDAQNSDLNDSIKVRVAQISAQSDFENQFRNVQTKLNIAKALSQTKQPTVIADAISSAIPSDISLSSITIDANTVQVKGVSGSEISIAQFVSNLKTNTLFKNVELSSVNSAETNSSLIVFIINITY